MREAHRPQITDLFKKHHSRLSDNAHKFKGTVVLDGGERDTHSRLKLASTSLCRKITCSRSVKSRRSLTYILQSQLLKT